MLRRPAHGLVALLAVTACGTDSDRPARASRAETAEVAPPAEQPPAERPPAPQTADPETLEAILPQPPAPSTLRHARQLARRGSWAEAAAVYDALVREHPDDVRYLAGRGYALAWWGDPRAVTFARRDLESALERIGADDPRLESMVRFNLGTLEERDGNTETALVQFEAAHRARPSRAARSAIERLGGEVPSTGERGCELVAPESARRVPTLRDVYGAIVSDPDFPPDAPPPADEDEIRERLCGGCDTTRPFVSTATANDDIVEAHLVVPAEGGYWLVPRLLFGNGPHARCPDETQARDVRMEAGRVRARAYALTNYYIECGFEEDEADEECMPGCLWERREDVEVILNPETGRYVAVRASRQLDLIATEPAAVLARDDVQIADGRIRVRACGEAATP